MKRDQLRAFRFAFVIVALLFSLASLGPSMMASYNVDLSLRFSKVSLEFRELTYNHDRTAIEESVFVLLGAKVHEIGEKLSSCPDPSIIGIRYHLCNRRAMSLVSDAEVISRQS